jgi:hypothetical protein
MQFIKTKVDSLGGGKEWQYVEHTPNQASETRFTIVADRLGIRLRGESGFIDSAEDLTVLAKAISEAWTMHKRMKPALDLVKAEH